MSLISQDFRLNKKQPKHRGPIRLRWALLAIAGVGIGAVIASTNTETKNDELAGDRLPTFKAVTKSTEQLARESFSLSLPELQARQEILDDANNLSPKQWREYKVKSGDNLARLFKRANIKPQQLDELMKSGEEAK